MMDDTTICWVFECALDSISRACMSKTWCWCVSVAVLWWQVQRLKCRDRRKWWCRPWSALWVRGLAASVEHREFRRLLSWSKRWPDEDEQWKDRTRSKHHWFTWTRLTITWTMTHLNTVKRENKNNTSLAHLQTVNGKFCKRMQLVMNTVLYQV